MSEWSGYVAPSAEEYEEMFQERLKRKRSKEEKRHSRK